MPKNSLKIGEIEKNKKIYNIKWAYFWLFSSNTTLYKELIPFVIVFMGNWLIYDAI